MFSPSQGTNHKAQGTRVARVLSIAGSDPSGGAGIQADIKTITALGGYASAAITALTAQNTRGVFGVSPVPPDFVGQQITLVLEDIGADAIKTGMLHSAEVIEAVAMALAAYTSSPSGGGSRWGLPQRSEPTPPLPSPMRGGTIPLVVDPVMVAKGGAALLKPDAVAALKKHLFPRAAVVTPNIPEAELLAGISIRNVADMEAAARAIAALGPQAVLLKGGHLEGGTVTDILLEGGSISRFDAARIDSRHTHGTGCTLASAIATFLAQGMTLKEAVSCARDYVRKAIANAPGLGAGHGPLGVLNIY